MKKFTIVAGVNGAGKSTLYQLDPDLKCENRVNADLRLAKGIAWILK